LRINALMAEVSHEAVTTGERAGQLRGNAGAVADDVAALRSVLVHTVRTATVEADRRLEARVTVDASCAIDLHAVRGAIPGKLHDISMHGAAIDIDSLDGISIGQHGNLVLTAMGNIRAPFEIRSIAQPGRLHIQFVDNKLEPAFRAAITRLIAGRTSASAAA
jgi:hypothetical protein